MKTAERMEARRLRREEGRSVKELAGLLRVSRSTISLWVRDIDLTDEQRADLCRRSGIGRIKGLQDERRPGARQTSRCSAHRPGLGSPGRRSSRSRLHALLGGRVAKQARSRVRQLRPGDGCLLPALSSTCFSVSDPKIRVTCNLFADHAERQREIESFWLRELGLPKTCLAKSTVNRYSKHSKKKRRNKLPYGTCRSKISDTWLVHEIRGAIQEYGGFDREGWSM
jgi:hypothetical protein